MSMEWFVVLKRDRRTSLLAGPFPWRTLAEAQVEAAVRLANELDPWSHFDVFGVQSFEQPTGHSGLFNRQLKISN